MRIIGGKYRGHKLTPPANNMIRPTSDRMRETIFNILSHSPAKLEGACVLDVFAGTGAMGLEALSRGAAHASFFDSNPEALRLVRHNIARLASGERTLTNRVIAPNFPASSRHYDVVFLDPPYKLDLIGSSLSALAKKAYFSRNSVIIAEYSSGNIPLFPDSFNIITRKIYGNTHFCFMEYTP